MASYRNVMELLAEEAYDQIQDGLDCCKCQQCRDDMIAYALNHLPPKYVVSHKGEIYSKTYSLSIQYRADLFSALAEAAQVVRKGPRHEQRQE